MAVDPRDRVRAVGAWLDASPTEVVGLTVMVLGAVAVAAAMWWTARPVELKGPASDPGVVMSSDGVAVPVGADEVTVHVAGAVVRPGLVTVPIGGRVADAVAAAGGPAADADLDPLNLARVLVDGERLVVPVIGAVVEGAPTEVTTTPGVRPDGRLDLNSATSVQLQALPGIGPVLAERIVAHRDANGPFTEVGQLREVTGIGERTFQGLADLVAV